MSIIAELLIPGAKQVLNYGQKLWQGMTPQTFARAARSNGAPVSINHPAYQYGHLALYPARFVEFLGLDATPFAPPPGYKELFLMGTSCEDDRESTIYPSMSSLTESYGTLYGKLYEYLPSIPDELFRTVNTEERTRERFPTKGAFAAYLLLAHHNTHLGQVSAWRRCMGLPGLG